MMVLLLIPIVSAAPQINEIMYNPEGDDYSYEFLEVWFGEEGVDVGGWYFEGVNFEFDDEVEVVGYVVISTNCTTFSERYGAGCGFEYKGTLKNDGELISFYDADGDLIDSVEYLPEWGGSKRGSLEKQESGKWIESEEDYGSPGEENSEGIKEPDLINDDGSESDEEDEVSDESDGGNEDDWLNDSQRNEHQLVKSREYVSPEPVVLEIGNGKNQSSVGGNEIKKEFNSSGEKLKDYGLYILIGVLICLLIYFVVRKG